MKKYIRVCNCCHNTFETDKRTTVCPFCRRLIEFPATPEEAAIFNGLKSQTKQ